MWKICYVVTIPTTIESFFISQLQYLSLHGFDVTVVCSKSDKLQTILGDTIRFYPINLPRGISFGGSIRAIKALLLFFKEEQFDLIQYSTPNAALYASIAAKAAGCKVRNYHLMGLRYLGSTGIGRIALKILERIACANSTHIECVSESNLEMGIAEGLFTREKVVVVWNGSTGGVDLRKFDYNQRLVWRKDIRAELEYTESDFIYGFVGRITRDKGINELLEAFLSLNDGSKLLLIGRMEGEDTLDKELLKKARANHDVRFHDAVTDIERYYAAIDVLMLPSYREGFGNVVIEAGAVGTPAIVSNIPGPTDTIDEGKTALTVEVKNVKDLAVKMKKMQSEDYVAMGIAAAEFSRDRFENGELCKRILERKEMLLGMDHI